MGEQPPTGNPLVEMVVGFYFRDDEVLLIKKRRPPWMQGLYNGPGGHIKEEKETALDAMVREFKEEAGVDVYTARWKHFCRLEGDGFVVFFYRADATAIDVEPRTQTDEAVKWCKLNDLPPVVSNLTWLLEMGNISQTRDWAFHVLEKR